MKLQRIMAMVIVGAGVFMVVSCAREPKNVRKTLRASMENSAELEKVIRYYQQTGDKEKLEAAYFLIGNMSEKYWLGGNEVTRFDPLFEVLDSLQNKRKEISDGSSFLKSAIDSITNIYGAPARQAATVFMDYNTVKASLLIENIDLAFKQYRETTWGQKLKFNDFLEYVLPYRIENEPLENWRAFLLQKYQPLLDSCSTKNSIEYTTDFFLHLRKILTLSINTMSIYDFDMPVSKMEKGRMGDCRQIVSYATMAFRSHGLPVCIDYTPAWANHNGAHHWNALLAEDGKFHPFNPVNNNASKNTLEYTPAYNFAKVYRKTFSPNQIEIPDNPGDVPAHILDRYRTDVTREYVKVFDIVVPLHQVENKSKSAVICTFNNKTWQPQDWGRIKENKAHFKNMGAGIVYCVFYYRNHQSYSSACDPFVLEQNGDLRFLRASIHQKNNMHLLRKYPCFRNTLTHLMSMVGVRFQGAKHADFRDSVNLFTVTAMPEKFETAIIKNSGKYRYVRYISRKYKSASVAEIEFHGGSDGGDTCKLNGSINANPDLVLSETMRIYTNAFDGNLDTYFYGKKRDEPFGWVGLDLGKPQRITKIRYCPRSDTNFILVGDTYELSYWEKGTWRSMGTRVAKEQFLLYENVPSNGLYLLSNLTKGKEERIFTYEKGQQVWW